jgi:hypothetical protein
MVAARVAVTVTMTVTVQGDRSVVATLLLDGRADGRTGGTAEGDEWTKMIKGRAERPTDGVNQ